MKWVTEVVRVNPVTGKHEKFIAEPVEAESVDKAQAWLNANRKGYLTATEFHPGEEVDYPEADNYFKSIKTLGRLFK